MLSLLEGRELTVNIFLTKHRLSTKPPEKPDMVAIGIIRLIEKESWMRTEQEKQKEETDEPSNGKKHKPEKKMGWRICLIQPLEDPNEDRLLQCCCWSTARRSWSA